VVSFLVKEKKLSPEEIEELARMINKGPENTKKNDRG
jgi:hypothetical protein